MKVRVRITNPDSLFHGEVGTVLRSFDGSGLGEPVYLIALDERGFGEHTLGLSFGTHEVVILASPGREEAS